MQYAYIRVSSADQNTARQEEALSKAGFQPDKICVEHASAKDTNRPGLQELLGQLRPGDTLLVHSIDRLCRNMSDMCAVTTRLRDQGVTLIFLKEQLTFSAGTNNPMQELQLHMMSAFSQFERALLKERQADGIAAKKARGEKTGRPGAFCQNPCRCFAPLPLPAGADRLEFGTCAQKKRAFCQSNHCN